MALKSIMADVADYVPFMKRPAPRFISESGKRIYGVLEGQFRKYFTEAERLKGNTGENLLVLLERRSDNVVLNLGLSLSRYDARQMVAHGHVYVGGRRMSVPSYLVRAGEHSTSAYLVDSGLLRLYYITDDGRERNKAFYSAGHCCGQLGFNPGFWRDGELRSCRISRYWRLRRCDPVVLRCRQRLSTAVSSRGRLCRHRALHWRD